MDSGTPGNQDALNLLGESKPIFVHLSEHLWLIYNRSHSSQITHVHYILNYLHIHTYFMHFCKIMLLQHLNPDCISVHRCQKCNLNQSRGLPSEKGDWGGGTALRITTGNAR
jgi:hypothetical protein